MKIILFTVFLFITIAGRGAQNNHIKYLNEITTDSLKISKKDFKYLVNCYLTKILDRDTLNTKDLIAIVRIYNTLTFNFPLREEYPEFYQNFSGEILAECVVNLYMTTWRNGSYYSKTYKLFIGGKSDSNSQYDVSD